MLLWLLSSLEVLIQRRYFFYERHVHLIWHFLLESAVSENAITSRLLFHAKLKFDIKFCY